MIGIICPSKFEYQALRRLDFDPRKISLCVSGMGKVRALHACHHLWRSRPGLSSVLLVGFAGGLTPNLKVGDVVEPSLFIEQDYDARPFERYPNVIKKNGRSSQGRRFLKNALDSVMLTQDRFVKNNPFGKFGPYAGKNKRIACDMESYAVAYFCENSKIRYSAVKLISDAADKNADHDFLKACRDLAPKLRETVREAVDRMSRR